MNYLLVNGATEVNQKWGAAESMGPRKHSSQEEQSDAGKGRGFKAVCQINLHAAPMQRSGRAVGSYGLDCSPEKFFFLQLVTTSSHAVHIASQPSTV